MSLNSWKINFTSHSFWEPFPHMEPTVTLILPAEIVNYNSTAHGDRNLWRVLPQTNSVLIWVCDEHFTPCPCKHVFFPFQSWRTTGILSIFLNILFRFALERETCYHFYLWLPHFISPINNHHMEKILKKTLPIPFFFMCPFTIKFCFSLHTEASHSLQHSTSAIPTYSCLFSLPVVCSFASAWFTNSIYISFLPSFPYSYVCPMSVQEILTASASAPLPMGRSSSGSKLPVELWTLNTYPHTLGALWYWSSSAGLRSEVREKLIEIEFRRMQH